MSSTDAPAPGARSGRPKHRKVQLPVFLAAGIALLTAVPAVQGKLQVFDVVCLLAAPFIVGRVWRYGLVRAICLTLVIWAVGQLLSDEVNGLGLRFSVLFVAAVTILAIVPVLVFLGRGDFRRIRCLVIGVAAGFALEQILVQHTPLTAPEGWKFGLNGPVAICLLALTDFSWQRGRRGPSVMALAAICVLGLATDHRQLAGTAVFTATMLLFRQRGPRHPKIISVLTGVVLLLAALSGAFLQAADAGVLGNRSGAQIDQFGNSPPSILVNVRPEAFQEFYLFAVNPLLGWGSLPRLNSETYLGSKEFLRDIGVVRSSKEMDSIWLDTEIPGVSAHSQAMDSWARAGLPAVPFWLLVLWLALRTGTDAIRFRSSPLTVFWTIVTLWDSLFSPLAGLSHIELAAYLALAVISLAKTPWSGTRSD